MLEPKTPLRDSTAHLRMSPPEFMPLPIARPLCGGQIRWIYVSSGSSPSGRIIECNALRLLAGLFFITLTVFWLEAAWDFACDRPSHRRGRALVRPSGSVGDGAHTRIVSQRGIQHADRAVADFHLPGHPYHGRPVHRQATGQLSFAMAVAGAIVGWLLLLPNYFYVVSFIDTLTIIKRVSHGLQRAADRTDRDVTFDAIKTHLLALAQVREVKARLPAEFFKVGNDLLVGLSGDATAVLSVHGLCAICASTPTSRVRKGRRARVVEVLDRLNAGKG